jgi:hypothetical protein
MVIQEDAGELLKFIYTEHTKGNTAINPLDIVKTTNWGPTKTNNAINYLDEIKDIRVIYRAPGHDYGVNRMRINGLTSSGLLKMENAPEFKRFFGIKLNLGLSNLTGNEIISK